MAIEGGCLCGAVRFTVDDEPIGTRTCWCRDCQYWGAGNGTTGARFKSDTLVVTGDVRWFESAADSGNRMARGFCATCGTPLFTRGVDTPEVTGVRVGTFDDPGRYPPEMVIWTASAPAWAPIDSKLPSTPGQPG